MVWFIIGLFIGAFIGYALACLMYVSSESDKQIKRVLKSHSLGNKGVA